MASSFDAVEDCTFLVMRIEIDREQKFKNKLPWCHIYISASPSLPPSLHTHTHMHACTHTLVHTCTHTHACTHTHTHILQPPHTVFPIRELPSTYMYLSHFCQAGSVSNSICLAKGGAYYGLLRLMLMLERVRQIQAKEGYLYCSGGLRKRS